MPLSSEEAQYKLGQIDGKLDSLIDGFKVHIKKTEEDIIKLSARTTSLETSRTKLWTISLVGVAAFELIKEVFLKWMPHG
jgi:hypothetical protein